MIDVILERQLSFGDVARKHISLPYAPFVGLIIITPPERYKREGKFVIESVVYSGCTILCEKAAKFYPGPHLNKEPTKEWVQEKRAEAEAARQATIEAYEAAGWSVKKSSEETTLNYSYPGPR